jgi:RNA polymerase sigma-70 factor (ECF subfamily)
MIPTNSLQDDLLILQCQQGDTRSFERLVQRWQIPLLNYAYRLTDSWPAAQDVVQETWLVVIRDLLALRDVTRFRPWLFRIASHKCQDHWRRTAANDRLAQTRPHHTPAGTAPEPPPETATTHRTDIHDALRRLDLGDRTILALMYLQELSVDDIADVLAVPEGTVKSRLFTAREHLRHIMEKSYGSP